MNAVFVILADGAFVAGDRDSGMTAYAFPTSSHAIVAKRYAKLVAEDMLGSERMSYRSVPAVKEYDLANWRKLKGALEVATIYRNTAFTKRNYECTNVVACELIDAGSSVPEGYEAADDAFRFYVRNLTPLWVEAGVRYYGYL